MEAFPAVPAVVRLAAALLLPSLAALAQTTVVLPCVKDNTLYESATGSLSNGRGSGLFVGVTGQPGIRRALLQFDVAANLPAGARVVSAQLKVNCVQSAFGGTVPVTVHRAAAAWGEGNSVANGGQGSGAPAATGDATWLHTFFSNQFWSTPGGDFTPVVSATLQTPPFGLCSSDVTAQLVADVQSMLDAPTQNFGWLLKTNEALAYVARKIDSRQSAGTPPTLTVTYLLPGQSTTVGAGCTVNGNPFGYALVGAPIGGTTPNLVQSNGPAGALAANLIALDIDPVGTLLPPGCALHLPLGGLIVTHSLVLLDGTGTATTPLPLPTGYTGMLMAFQSAALDTINPAGYVLSNAVAALLQ